MQEARLYPIGRGNTFYSLFRNFFCCASDGGVASFSFRGFDSLPMGFPRFPKLERAGSLGYHQIKNDFPNADSRCTRVWLPAFVESIERGLPMR